MADAVTSVDRSDIPLTHRRVLAIALPIVLSNATIPLLGAVDTGVVGQLGRPEPIGAVGMGAVILASLYWIFGFLRMGTSGLVAQAHGAGDQIASGAHLLRALTIAVGIGLTLIVLQGPLLAAAFRLSPASAEVEGLARHYLGIRIWGAPATIAMYALTGWLIAVERTRAILVVQLLMTIINVALDLWFVLGFGWGVAGVAAATLIAEWCAVALALWFARAAIAAGLRRRGLWAREGIARLVRVNGDIMVRSVLLQSSYTAFVFFGAAQGDVTLAANQILLQFLSITAYALDGFAFSAESLVGQAVGAARPGRVRRAAILTSQWGLGGALALGVVFGLWGGQVIDVLTTAPDVRETARAFLPWVAIAPCVGIAGWMLDGIFIGATLTREMRDAMLLSVALYVVGLVTLPAVMGNHGLWAAFLVLNVARGLTMARLYPRAEAVARTAR